MRKITSLTTAAFLFVLLSANPQHATAGDNTRVQIKGVVLTGEVSRDGKKLLADDDNEWTVSNADSLKGLSGRYIAVRCRMDPATRSIRVLSIVDQPAANHAQLGDAAFRR